MMYLITNVRKIFCIQLLVIVIIDLMRSVVLASMPHSIETMTTKSDIHTYYPYGNRAGSLLDDIVLWATRTHDAKANYLSLLNFESPPHDTYDNRSVERIALRIHGAICNSSTAKNIPLVVGILYNTWSIDEIRQKESLPNSRDFSSFIPGEDISRSEWQDWREFTLWPSPLANEGIAPEIAIDMIRKNGISIYVPVGRNILTATCILDSSESGFAPEIIVTYGASTNESHSYLPFINGERPNDENPDIRDGAKLNTVNTNHGIAKSHLRTTTRKIAGEIQ